MKQGIAAFLGAVLAFILFAQVLPVWELGFVAALVAAPLAVVLVDPKAAYAGFKARLGRLTLIKRTYLFLSPTRPIIFGLNVALYGALGMMWWFSARTGSTHLAEGWVTTAVLSVVLFCLLYCMMLVADFFSMTSKDGYYPRDERLAERVKELQKSLLLHNPVVFPFWAAWQLLRFTLWSFKTMAWMMKEAAKQAYNNLFIAGLLGGIFGYLLGRSLEVHYPIPWLLLGACLSILIILLLRLRKLLKT